MVIPKYGINVRDCAEVFERINPFYKFWLDEGYDNNLELLQSLHGFIKGLGEVKGHTTDL